MGPKGRLNTLNKRKKLLPLAGMEPRFLGHQVRSVFPLLTELPQQYTVGKYKSKVYKKRKLNI